MQYTLCAIAAATSLALAGTLGAQSRESSDNGAFQWSGNILSGRSILVRNVNGPVRVEHSSTGKVEVTAEKRWRRGDPADVRIVQPNISGGDVIICALWQADATCDERGIHTPRNYREKRDCSVSCGRDSDNRNDVSVHFVVRVPDGVRVDVATVNGPLELNDVNTELRANTVNGSIEARETRGPTHAETVNGSISISMGGTGGTEAVDYQTVNGSITLALPTNFGAQLELSTVTGRVSTDFPITIVGTFSPRTLRGTIGNGAMHIQATTVNGSVTLRRAN